MESNGENNTILDMLLKTPSWNSRAMFHVILLHAISADWRPLIPKILASFWKHFVINIIISVSVDDRGAYLKIFTWMPYMEGNCGQNTSDFFEVASCQGSKLELSDAGVFSNKVSGDIILLTGHILFIYLLFKLPLNLNKCPLRLRATIMSPYVIAPEEDNLAIFHSPNENIDDGFEVTLIKIFANRRNLSLTIL